MIRRYTLLSGLLFVSAAYSIVDNRYFPLYKRGSLTTLERPSKFGTGFYFIAADEARDNLNNVIGIPELLGKFDQVKTSAALALVGKTNPLDPQFKVQNDGQLTWDWTGKISGQGLHFDFEKAINCKFSIGAAWDLMHVQSRNEFELSKDTKTNLMSLSTGKVLQLEQERRQINDELGLASGVWSKTGVSDVDIYLKYNWLKEYYLKCKSVDASATFGVWVPTSVKIDLDNPASLPFGGNGHTGLYLSGALNLELKEDLIFGLDATFAKRIPKTMLRRMPVNGEPLQYGAVKGNAKVNPGFTFAFSAYLEMLDFWDAIGFRGGYNLAVHGKDKWTDKRDDKSIAVKLNDVEKNSSWMSEYIRLGFVYNLTNIKKFKKFEPRLYLDVDVPAHFFWAKATCRTNRVSIGIEASF
jgi:hypothetical protein